MACYTNAFIAADATQDLRQAISGILERCELRVTYNTPDYLLAQEKNLGKTPHWHLVTVEVNIHHSPSRETRTMVNLIVRSEELPLKADNHCQQIFAQINQAFCESGLFQVL